MHNFHFSSERKRMGILLHSRKQKQCVFFMKGADSVMETLIEDQR
jgi:magnesium-transporting ATPase (P-type)